MRETLHLSPTAPIRTIGANADTTLVGGDGDAANPADKWYEVKAGQMIIAQVVPAMRDARCVCVGVENELLNIAKSSLHFLTCVNYSPSQTKFSA